MRKSTLVASHIAVFLAGVVLATALVARALPGTSSSDRYATLDSLAQAMSYISNEYVDEVDERRLVYSAIRGMVRGLDKHSAFLGPNSYKRLREDTEGEFGGVGFELGSPPTGSSPYPVVESLIAGSPAARAGIREGMAVIEVAGRSTVAGDDIRDEDRRAFWSELSERLRGPAGTRLELITLDEQGVRTKRALVREDVKVPTVEWLDLPGKVGVVAISRFQDATAADTEAALRALRSSHGGAIGTLILDLRDNPGGLYDQAIRVADLFLSEGLIVKVSARGGSHIETETANSEGTYLGFPMIVLMNSGSASAAEIVAGALQDHGRAMVVGLQSYGKGSVQTFLDLDDGSGLKLTTSRYLTPAGRSLEGAGIYPDVQVEEFEAEVISANSTQENRSDARTAGTGAAKNAKILGHLAGEVRNRLEDDLQLRVAYEMAHSWQRKREGNP